MKKKHNHYIIVVDSIPFPTLRLAAKRMNVTDNAIRYYFRDVMECTNWASAKKEMLGFDVEMFVYGADVLSSLDKVSEWKTDNTPKQGDNYETEDTI